MPIYGVRGPDPRNTVVAVLSRKIVGDMLNPDDVLMVKDGTCPHTNQCACPGGWRDVDDDDPMPDFIFNRSGLGEP